MSIVNPKLVDFDTLGAAVDFLKIAIFQPMLLMVNSIPKFSKESKEIYCIIWPQ